MSENLDFLRGVAEDDLLRSAEQVVQDLERQLAEAQAVNAELREALEDVRDSTKFWEWLEKARAQGDDVSEVDYCCHVAWDALQLPFDTSALERAIAAAVAQEREACAKVCRDNRIVQGDTPWGPVGAYNNACHDCAEAIRKRQDSPTP